MRWKLLIITSLVAVLASAGGSLALAYWSNGLAGRLGVRDPVFGGVVLVPLVLVTLASVFVYRHTARRRKLQAALTALLSIILTLAALFAAQMFLKPPPGGTPSPISAPQTLT